MTSILLVYLMFLLYLQRVVLSVAIVPISQEQSWDADTQGILLSCFFWYESCNKVGQGVF